MHNGGTRENGVSSGPEQIFVFVFLAKDRQRRGGGNETCLEIERKTDREIRNESERSEQWVVFLGFFF